MACKVVHHCLPFDWGETQHVRGTHVDASDESKPLEESTLEFTTLDVLVTYLYILLALGVGWRRGKEVQEPARTFRHHRGNMRTQSSTYASLTTQTIRDEGRDGTLLGHRKRRAGKKR